MAFYAFFFDGCDIVMVVCSIFTANSYFASHYLSIIKCLLWKIQPEVDVVVMRFHRLPNVMTLNYWCLHYWGCKTLVQGCEKQRNWKRMRNGCIGFG